LACTNPEDLVLDPFLGSGTTSAVAMKLRGNSIGIEKNKKYLEIIKICKQIFLISLRGDVIS